MTGYLRVDGYRQLRRSDLEHVVVAERALGKGLPAGACVHHVNEKRSDNRPDNLVICPDEKYHQLLHRRMRALAACGNPDWLLCHYCKKYDDPKNMYIRGTQQRHRECFNKAWRDGYSRRKAASSSAP